MLAITDVLLYWKSESERTTDGPVAAVAACFQPINFLNSSLVAIHLPALAWTDVEAGTIID